MKQINWGVLSTAKIGLNKVIPALQASRRGVVAAIASRDRARAEEAARKLGIPRFYGSYEELLADRAIDAVYIPLPNHLHVAWSIEAMKAGKHVLCEKPLGLDSRDAQRLVDAAKLHPRLKVMEAFMYRHHPQWLKARQLVAEGGIGKLRTVHTLFSYSNLDPQNIRNRADIGGGGLMDIGCYCISLSRFLFGSEPRRVVGIAERDPAFGTDRMTSGILEFEGGTATFTCSTQLVPHERVNIFGTEGRIELERPFNAPLDRGCKVIHQKGATITEHVVDVCNHYTIQGDLFAEAILNDTPVPTPLSDAVENMRVIESLLASAVRGVWV